MHIIHTGERRWGPVNSTDFGRLLQSLRLCPWTFIPDSWKEFRMTHKDILALQKCLQHSLLYFTLHWSTSPLSRPGKLHTGLDLVNEPKRSQTHVLASPPATRASSVAELAAPQQPPPGHLLHTKASLWESGPGTWRYGSHSGPGGRAHIRGLEEGGLRI